MLLVTLTSALPSALRAAAEYDPDHSLAGLALGCTGGWIIAWVGAERARLKAQRNRAKPNRDSGRSPPP